MKEQITRTMTIDQILSGFPQKSQKLAQELTNAGLQCAGCSASTWETLEAGMFGHGMEDEEINSLVTRLNDVLSEKTEDPTTISLTEKAAEKFLAILKDEKKESWGMRFGERAAGCSGFEYYLDFSEKPKSDDLVFSSSGIQIHVNGKSAPRLLGCVIDYVDGLHGAGFKISNPHVKSSCGCGHSHGY